MPGKPYPQEIREAALTCLAVLGNTALTSELTGITGSTLRSWARAERLARQSAVKLLTRETEQAADAAEIRLQEAQARLARTQAQLAQVRQERSSLAGGKDAAPGDGPDSLHSRLEQLALVNMLEDAMRLSESLGDAIEDAPLGQRATALNQLLDKILKVMALMPRQEDVFVRVEFEDTDGATHQAPPWARADSGE